MDFWWGNEVAGCVSRVCHHHDEDDGGRRCRVRDGARRASDRPSRVPPPPRVVFDRVTARDDPVLDGVSPRAPTRDALSSRVETHTTQHKAFFFLLCFWGTQRRRRLENGDGIDWWNDDVVDDVRHVDVSCILRGIAERAFAQSVRDIWEKERRRRRHVSVVVRISGVGALRRR